MHKRFLAFAAVAVVAFAACTGGGGATTAPGTGSAATTAPGTAAAGGCTIGVSWNNYQEERWEVHLE